MFAVRGVGAMTGIIIVWRATKNHDHNRGKTTYKKK